MDIEDRALQIHTKIQRDKSPVAVYLINGSFRTKGKNTSWLTGATIENLVGVYDECADLGYIEDDMMAMAK